MSPLGAALSHPYLPAWFQELLYLLPGRGIVILHLNRDLHFLSREDCISVKNVSHKFYKTEGHKTAIQH